MSREDRLGWWPRPGRKLQKLVEGSGTDGYWVRPQGSSCFEVRPPSDWRAAWLAVRDWRGRVSLRLLIQAAAHDAWAYEMRAHGASAWAVDAEQALAERKTNLAIRLWEKVHPKWWMGPEVKA